MKMIGEKVLPRLHKYLSRLNSLNIACHFPLTKLQFTKSISQELANHIRPFFHTNDGCLPIQPFVLNERIRIAECIISGMVVVEHIGLIAKTLQYRSTEEGYLLVAYLSIIDDS